MMLLCHSGFTTRKASSVEQHPTCQRLQEFTGSFDSMSLLVQITAERCARPNAALRGQGGNHLSKVATSDKTDECDVPVPSSLEAIWWLYAMYRRKMEGREHSISHTGKSLTPTSCMPQPVSAPVKEDTAHLEFPAVASGPCRLPDVDRGII